MKLDLGQPLTQEQFGELVGISQQMVSRLVADEILAAGADAQAWILSYCGNLREQAAGRDPSGELSRQRARVAKEQADGLAMKNEVMRGQYAPVGLLADVLASASSGVSDRFDQLEGALKRACPNLPEEARTVVMQVIASARNEWVRVTSTLIAKKRAEMQADDEAVVDELGAE